MEPAGENSALEYNGNERREPIIYRPSLFLISEIFILTVPCWLRFFVPSPVPTLFHFWFLSSNMDISSIFFGLFIGLFLPTLTKVIGQTRSIWRRTRSLANAYLYMIWIEAIVNLIFSITTYLYLCGVIPPRWVWPAFYWFSALTRCLVLRISLVLVGHIHALKGRTEMLSELTNASATMGDSDPTTFANHRQPYFPDHG
jgi:hypothetical protein